MDEQLNNKQFESETEEAQFWEDNQDALTESFEKAAEEGTLGRGTAVLKVKTDTSILTEGLRTDVNPVFYFRSSQGGGKTAEAVRRAKEHRSLMVEELQDGFCECNTTRTFTLFFAADSVVPYCEVCKKQILASERETLYNSHFDHHEGWGFVCINK